MVLHELGFPAIAPMTEHILLKSSDMETLQNRYKHIIVFMDSDETGLKCNEKYKQAYDICTAFIPFQFKIKDISDFRKRFKTVKTKKLLKRLIIETTRVRGVSFLPYV